MSPVAGRKHIARHRGSRSASRAIARDHLTIEGWTKMKERYETNGERDKGTESVTPNQS